MSRRASYALRGLTFLARWVVAGLALAFVLVYLRPDLLGRARTEALRPLNEAGLPIPPTTSFAQAVARSSPAVVNIYTERVVTERVRPRQLDRFFGDDWPTVRQRVQSSLGSGVIVDTEGHVVTNHHVIDGASGIRIQLADGRIAPVRLVGTDPESDLAVLKIELADLPVMPLGRSDGLRVGDIVLAIGNPLGLTQTVTQGIVSATGRGQLGLIPFEDFIQTDAAINLGNSGGALVNSDGEMIGINTAVLSQTVGSEGIGFAIPVNLVRGVMDQILRHGRVRRGWLGVLPELYPTERLPADGVVLRGVCQGSPADRAGLRPGDEIIRLNSEAVDSAREALSRVAAMSPGSTINIEGRRGATTFTVDIVIIEREPTSQRCSPTASD